MLWWGIFTACSAVFKSSNDAGEADWGYATVVGPIFVTVSSCFVVSFDLSGSYCRLP